MLLYKLTDQYGWTRPGETNACQWGPGVSHSGTGEGPLCGPGWIHAYINPRLAVLLNPIHAGYSDPRLWEADGEVALSDRGFKVGCRTLTTLREIQPPVFTLEDLDTLFEWYFAGKWNCFCQIYRSSAGLQDRLPFMLPSMIVSDLGLTAADWIPRLYNLNRSERDPVPADDLRNDG